VPARSAKPRKTSREGDVASVNRLEAGTAPGTRAKMLP
jgi:hypothetical protein